MKQSNFRTFEFLRGMKAASQFNRKKFQQFDYKNDYDYDLSKFSSEERFFSQMLLIGKR